METNKILLIVENSEEEKLVEENFQPNFFKTIQFNELIKTPNLVEDYLLVLDSTSKIYCFLLQSGLKEEKEKGFPFVKKGETKFFILPSIDFFLNKKREIYFDEEGRQKIKKTKTEVLKLIHLLETTYFAKELNKKEKLNFSELVIEHGNKKFNLVKEIPQEKKEGVEYLTIENAKELNRIFDIIDSVVENE